MSQLNRTVIMLSGYMQSGKDTVGRILVENFGFARFAFADTLKDDVSNIYGIPRGSLDTPEGKATLHSSGETVRTLLIRHGEDMRRKNPNHWVERVVNAIEREEKATGKVLRRIVVTDWRFPGEWHALSRILDVHIETWRVNRWDRPPLDDPTELALDDFPFHVVISNSASRENLFLAVCEHIYALRQSNVKILLTDVDEVLLNWVSAFRDWVGERGEDCQLQGDSDLLVRQFNSSPAFQDIQPRVDSQAVLKRVKRAGYHIVALSSCGDDPVTWKRREECLKMNFSGCIDRLICLPLGARKKDHLRSFPPAIFIDDAQDNVRDGVEAGHQSYLMQGEVTSEPLERELLPVLRGWKDVFRVMDI